MAWTEGQDDETSLKVLVTGFGAFLDVRTNPSWEIVAQLPSELYWKGLKIRIITHSEPLKAAYHDLLAVVPPLLDAHNPDIVVHIGLAVDRDYFAIENGAEKEGYHQYPDESRKVFTKAETKSTWGKSPSRLESSLDIEDVAARWKRNVTKDTDVRPSDDVGDYVCGFVYYTSLEHMRQKGLGDNPVVFLHVPQITGEKEIKKGRDVVVGLLQAIAETQRF